MSNVSYCLGLDPGGSSGGIAVMNSDGSAYDAWSMRTMTLKDIWTVCSMRARQGRLFAMLEKVHAMPKQGVSSTFKFGANYGALEMALVGGGVEYETVSPGVWQRSMKCLTKGNKNVTKEAAEKLFPDAHVTHAIADALLLAEYARRQCVERGTIVPYPE